MSEQSDGMKAVVSMDLDRAEHLLIHGMSARERDGLIRWLRERVGRAAIADMVEALVAASGDEAFFSIDAATALARIKWSVEFQSQFYYGESLHSALEAAMANAKEKK